MFSAPRAHSSRPVNDVTHVVSLCLALSVSDAHLRQDVHELRLFKGSSRFSRLLKLRRVHKTRQGISIRLQFMHKSVGLKAKLAKSGV